MKEILRPHRIIAYYLSCNVHCAVPMMDAVRQTVQRYWPRGAFNRLPRHERRFALASIIQQHGDNATLYDAVMTGDFKVGNVRRYLFDPETKQVSPCKPAH